MKSVKVIDVTLRGAAIGGDAHDERDGMDADWIDLVGGAVFDVCVRYLREDPWQRIGSWRSV